MPSFVFIVETDKVFSGKGITQETRVHIKVMNSVIPLIMHNGN